MTEEYQEINAYAIPEKILSVLLEDKSSEKNIVWATDNYAQKGYGYQSNDAVSLNAVTGRYGWMIQPRTQKTKEEQLRRIKDKAEVFTPLWICNSQNNLIDTAWFGREGVFNREIDQTWIVNEEKIIFEKTTGKTWQDYIRAERMEITCGEAPYLVSRYDTVTGEKVEIKKRIGLLDRKLRIVNENCSSEKEWVRWAKVAFQSTYGFEWQGDNLFIARKNLLLTFIDYYLARFEHFPIMEYLSRFANIIAWNIFQMDGLKYVIPNSCKKVPEEQMSFFDFDGDNYVPKLVDCPGCVSGNPALHNGIRCRIRDWKKNISIEFLSTVEDKQ